jgi:hypothetical protein
MSVQFYNFKKTIKEFLKLDEEIRSLSKARLERVKKRNRLTKEITLYYKTNNIRSMDLKLEDGTQFLELVESERHPSVNQKFLREALSKYCNNDKIVDNMINHILEERENNSSVSFKLKRVIPSNKKNKLNTSNAMSLTQDDEKLKIQERFMKLADYAILKDGIGPLNNNMNQIESIKDSIKGVIQKDTNTPQEVHSIKEEVDEEEVDEEEVDEEEVNEKEIKNKEVEAEEIDNEDIDDEDIDEEEVDLDDIPVEETGYIEDPPQLEEPFPKNNTIKNIISRKLDSLENENLTGSIPVPISKPIVNKDPVTILKEYEIKAIDSWKKLDELSPKHPIIGKWLLLQKEKIKLYKLKDQIAKQSFIEMNDKLNKSEKSFEKINYTDEIIKLKEDIVDYISFRFQK